MSIRLPSFKTGHKLRNKIFAMSALVAGVPILVGGILILYIFSIAHEQNIAAVKTNLVLRQASEIEASLEIRMRVINTLAGTVDLESENDLMEAVESLLHSGYAEASIALAENGQEIAFKSFFEQPDYPDTEEDLEQKYVDEEEYFIKAVAGEAYIGPVEASRRHGLISRIALPIKNSLGETTGVISGLLEISPILEKIKEARFGGSGYSYLVDERRQLIGQRELGSSASGYVYFVDVDGRLLAHSDETKTTTADFSSFPMVQAVLRGDFFMDVEGLRYYDSPWGEKVVAAGIPIVSPPIRGAIIAEWPLSDANNAFEVMRAQLIIFLLLAFVLAMAGSIVLANKIVVPVKQLEEGAKKVAEGNFDFEANIKTNDEIEEFAQTFNEMIKDLKRLDELKKEFVFIASHELKAPVNAINGYIKLITDGTFGEAGGEVGEFLNEIKKCSERLKRLVHELLDVARSEAGRLEIAVAPVKITNPINDVINEMKSLADEKSITVSCEPVDDIPEVLADEDRIKEVMINLVSNAIKYTLNEGRIEIFHEIKDGKLITSVKDQGIGMTKEQVNHLFEKFYRAKTEETQNIEGTGLGLFIVKQIIEKMGGEIWVESEKDKGSVFSFSLLIVSSGEGNESAKDEETDGAQS